MIIRNKFKFLDSGVLTCKIPEYKKKLPERYIEPHIDSLVVYKYIVNYNRLKDIPMKDIYYIGAIRDFLRTNNKINTRSFERLKIPMPYDICGMMYMTSFELTALLMSFRSQTDIPFELIHESEVMLTEKDVMWYFSCPLSQVLRMIKDGLPYYKIYETKKNPIQELDRIQGENLRFRYGEILAYVSKKIIHDIKKYQ